MDYRLRHRTRINWYLATVNSQLVYYTGEQQLADNLTDGTPPSHLYLLDSANRQAFIFLLPLGGLISTPSHLNRFDDVGELIKGIPAIGWLLDTRPMRDVIIILGVMGISFGALTLTSTIVPQLIGIGVLVVARPLFYTAISDYAAKVFGCVRVPPFSSPFFLHLYILSPTSSSIPLLSAREKKLMPDSKHSEQSTV